MIANVLVEIPYQVITGVLIYACFYYPVVGIQSSERQGLVLLFIIQLFIYASAFAQMTIAALPDAQTAGSIVTLLSLMSTIFCGVLQTPSALPGFWIFMYRVSPFTYWIGGIVSTMLHGRPVTCSASETSIFDPPSGQTCGQYLAPFLEMAPGRLQNPDSKDSCRYCTFDNADQYLAGSNIFWSQRWRNFGIMWAYILFNIFMAISVYYLFRVKSWHKGEFKSNSNNKKPSEKESGVTQTSNVRSDGA
jgi:ABC-type multidrug transport system permease subunit